MNDFSKLNNTRWGRSSQGSALVLVVVLLTVLMISLSALWRGLHRSHAEIDRMYRDSVAWHYAEGGVHWAAAQILHENPDFTSVNTLEMPEGWVEVQIQPEAQNAQYAISATGHYGTTDKSIRSITLEAGLQKSAQRVHITRLEITPKR